MENENLPIFTGPVVNGIAQQYYFQWTGTRVEMVYIKLKK